MVGLAKNPHMYGDLLLTPEQEKLLNIGGSGTSVIQGFLTAVRFWPNRILPYQLDSSLSKYIATVKIQFKELWRMQNVLTINYAINLIQ